MFELPLPEYWAYRQSNPYKQPQDPTLKGTKFWNKSHRDVYQLMVKDRKNTFVPNVKSISLAYMSTNPDYFGEALALCEKFGICDIISFNKAFDADLLAQFFATVYFLKCDDRTLTWMCHDEVVSYKWEVFM